MDFSQSILPYLTTWYFLVFAVYCVYRIFLGLDRYIKSKKLGCLPAFFANDGWYGFKVVFTILQKKKEGILPDFVTYRFESLGVDTFKFTVVGNEVVSTRDPENIKAILATQFNDFSLGIRHSQFKILLGDGIFTLDGQGWKHSRAMLRPQFAREQVSHVQALEPHIQKFAQHVRLHSDGSKFDIQELFFRLTVDSATEFLFGESVDTLMDDKIAPPGFVPTGFEDKQKFANAFNISQNYLSTRAACNTLYFLVNTKKFRECNKLVHDFANYYVDGALNTSEEELDKKSQGGYIFLYELVKHTRDPKVLRDQLLNILVAGRDTTAGLLSFVFYEISRNPQIWNKLKEEIHENFGSGDDSRLEEITFESLKKCEYLKAVINEALRLYPSVPQNFRIATKDTSLPKGGGPDGQSPIFIPKGETVGYSVYATHRMVEYYGKDAKEFRPERWFEPNCKKLGWAYVPFNGGPRICLGQQFALTEASYVITRLIQLFPNIKTYDTQYPPQKMSHLTMSLFNGVWVGLTE